MNENSSEQTGGRPFMMASSAGRMLGVSASMMSSATGRRPLIKSAAGVGHIAAAMKQGGNEYAQEKRNAPLEAKGVDNPEEFIWPGEKSGTRQAPPEAEGSTSARLGAGDSGFIAANAGGNANDYLAFATESDERIKNSGRKKGTNRKSWKYRPDGLR